MTHPIPESALARHTAILGKTGSGKTYTAKGAVEFILDAGGRVCIIDPTGAYWGLRMSASGKGGSGYQFVIFGGTYGDFPLTGEHGEAIAEIIGTSSTPAILDTSQMRVGERTRFFAAFAEALIRKNRGPLHLVIDEAHLFAPQGRVNDPQSGAMLHAANNLVSLGRSRGLRIMMVSQRPAKLHKDSLTQVETLIAMRLVAPHDRRAVEDWIADNADAGKARDVIQSLATLKDGEGWIWSPEVDILKRVKFPRIKTFDSSSAPDAHGAAIYILPPINHEAIDARLKLIATQSADNDPKALRAMVARLNARVAELSKQHIDPATKEDIERAAYGRGYGQGSRGGYASAKENFTKFLDKLAACSTNAIGELNKLTDTIMDVRLLIEKQELPRVSVVKDDIPPTQRTTEAISKTVRAILDQIHRASPMALSYEAASLRAGVSRRSSAYSRYRKQIEASPEVQRRADGRFMSAPGYATEVDTRGSDPIEAFASRLPRSFANMLRKIAEARQALTAPEIAKLSDISPTSSGLMRGIRELIALALVEQVDKERYTISRDLATWSQLESRGNNGSP